tara:strand:+ start:233 stop:658 length:426 start_codon:yes stop_codon:yes gene_type:complete
MSKRIDTVLVSDRADYFVQYLTQVGEAINNLNDKVEELQKADDGLTESGVERIVHGAMDNFDFSDVIYNENLATEGYVDDVHSELDDKISETVHENDLNNQVKGSLFDLLLKMAESVEPELWRIREGKRKELVSKTEEVAS